MANTTFFVRFRASAAAFGPFPSRGDLLDWLKSQGIPLNYEGTRFEVYEALDPAEVPTHAVA